MGLNDVGYLKHFSYPPEPEGRTVVRDPIANLALAVIQDAVDLTFTRIPAALSRSEQRKLAHDIKDAKGWVLDYDRDAPVSLRWCCDVLSVFGGWQWDAQAISDAYRAGRIQDWSFNRVPRNGGPRRRVGGQRNRRRLTVPQARGRSYH